MHPNRLTDFIASAEEAKLIEEHFSPCEIKLDFAAPDPSDLATIPQCGGVYLIAGARENDLLKIYVGKTKNVRARIRDYARAFQVHCPNDRKLAFFQEWLARVAPEWSLSLRVQQVDKPLRAQVEAQWIRRLVPLVNGTGKPDEDARAAIREASRHYFESFFVQRAVQGRERH